MTYDDYLYHHGILGQKWGKRNGPPYPLDYSDMSKSERAKAALRSGKIQDKKSARAYIKKQAQYEYGKTLAGKGTTMRSVQTARSGVFWAGIVLDRVGVMTVNRAIQSGKISYETGKKIAKAMNRSVVGAIGVNAAIAGAKKKALSSYRYGYSPTIPTELKPYVKGDKKI